MRISVLMALIFVNLLYAKSEILESECIRFSVSQDGSLGDGQKPPGIQFDRECQGNFSDDVDYLTPQVPYEYYAISYEDNVYFVNNSLTKSGKPSIRGFKDFSIDKNNNSITTRATTFDDRIQVEQTYRADRKKIIIQSKITNLSPYAINDIYFSRGLDPDVDYHIYKNMKTINTRGFNNTNERDFVYTESQKTSSPIGLYSHSEIPHNTSVFPFKNWKREFMDPKVHFNGLTTGVGSKDSIINIAFKIDQLKSNESKVIDYRYVCSSDITKTITMRLGIDASEKSFWVSRTTNKSYELIKSFSSFEVRSNGINSITFPLRVDGIPEGIEIKINNTTFSKDNRQADITLDCNNRQSIEILRNNEFKVSKPFELHFKAGQVKGNKAEWFGSDEFKLTLKPRVPKGVSVDLVGQGRSYPMPYAKSSAFETIDATPSFKLKSQDIASVAFDMSINNIPSGVKLEIEGKSFTQANNQHPMKLDMNQAINIKVMRNQEFRKESPFELDFEFAAIEGVEAQWSTKPNFSLSFEPIREKGSITTRKEAIVIPYKWVKEYERVAQSRMTLTRTDSQKGRNNNIHLTLSNIPQGIEVEIMGHRLSPKNNTIKSLNLESERAYPITIYRNREFTHKEAFEIHFEAKSNSHTLKLSKSSFDLNFQPKARELTLKPSTTSVAVSLANPDHNISFALYEGSRVIIGEELDGVELATPLMLNYTITRNKEGFRLELKGMQKKGCLPPKVKVGANSVAFNISTPYPNEKPSTSITMSVEDIAFWEKWGCVIVRTLIILLFLLWLYGVVSNKKFAKSNHIKIEREGRKPSHIYFARKVNFFSKLIPFRDQRVSIEGTTFVAASRKGGAMIPKRSQTKRLNIDGEELDESAGKRDIRLIGGMGIIKRKKTMRFYV